ncbi:bifunctional phosphopantothenoylcysteine decarboxylase/phosphopantothenate synthase [Altererythrobacter sp. MF3-039]|uniref:bifunctional phosphopantothenoylcysteine decarboxylase/phosphopantothenate synthase n=1 Tax=Altererythrobacter sp. MF3-039 TaxID=3252901 RepID=UPI00390C4074
MDRGFDHAGSMAGSDADPDEFVEGEAGDAVTEPKILLIVGGGIAAYKACEVVRLIRKGGGSVNCVVTDGGQQFVTPMALAALSENPVHTTLWDLKNESEMGHIQLSREADLVVVCPATADILAKMAAGIADDLATTLILATDKPVMVAPAMNVRMWEHEATQRNVEWLREAGVSVLEPDEGEMACGEFGPGRLPDPEAIWAAIAEKFGIDYEVPVKAAPSFAAEEVEEEPEAEGVETEDTEAASQDALRKVRDAEPEEEEYEEEQPRSGLGSLLSAIIPRSTKKRTHEEIEEEVEAELEAVAEIEAEEPADEPVEVEEASDEEVAEAPEPGFSSLLASKGGAKSAPPTDPDAVNHEVVEGKQAPEPIPGDDFAGAPSAEPEPVDMDAIAPQEVVEDAVAGQPAFSDKPEYKPLEGKHVLITAGPTHEPIDPVRYLANRSSGKQGYSIAAMAAAAGAKVTLISGPVNLTTPPGVDRIDVESAEDMAAAVKKALPADVAIMAAAVADWKTKERSGAKMKKRGSAPPALLLTENPDILANVASGKKRPGLLIGFAAETEDVVENAKVKRKRKGVDWIIANDVSGDVMGGDTNTIHIVRQSSVETLDELPKMEVAKMLIEHVVEALKGNAEDE